MALTDHSFESVKIWGTKHFTADFEHLPGAKDITLQINVPTDSKGLYVTGLIVGSSIVENNTSRGTVDILAWLNGNCMKIGYTTKMKCGTFAIHLKTITDCAITFHEPFSWVIKERGNTSVARFEALVRYCFLVKGAISAVKNNFQHFVDHFPGACQDISAHRPGKPQESGVPDCEAVSAARHRDIHAQMPNTSHLYGFEIFVNSLDKGAAIHTFGSPSSSPPPVEVKKEGASSETAIIVLSSPSPSPEPVEVTSTTGRSLLNVSTKDSQNLKSESMDDKTQVKNEAEASNEQNAEQLAGFRRKVYDLNIRLMIAEGLSRNSEAEAALWKSKYEELREMVEGNCGRRKRKMV